MFKQIKIPRLPFYEDQTFSALFFLLLLVPLAFSVLSYEKFETVKLAVWFVSLSAPIVVSIKAKVLQSNKKFIGFCLLGALLLLPSLIYSQNLINSLLGSYPRLDNSFIFWFVFVFTIIFFSTQNIYKKLSVFYKVLFFDATVVGLIAVLQSYGVGFYNGVGDTTVFARAPSLLGNPNFSTMFLSAVLPLSLPLIFSAKSLKARVYYIFGSFFIVAGICLLSSRAGWLALVFLAVVTPVSLAIFRFNLRKILAALFLGFFSLALLWQTNSISRPQSLQASLNLSETNINLRFFVWDIALTAITQHPLTGVGPGNFQLFFENQRSAALSDQNGVFDDAHNLFLNMGATLGLPFLIWFLAFGFSGLFLVVRSLRQKILSEEDYNLAIEEKFYLLSIGLGVLAWYISAAFNPVSSACFLLLGFYLAVMFSKRCLPTNIGLNPVTRMLLGFLAACLLMVGISYTLADHLFMQGRTKFFQQKFQASSKLLLWSSRLAPNNLASQSYKIASDMLRDGVDEKVLEQKISKFKRLIPQDAKTDYLASKLNFLAYDRTGQREFLKKSIEEMNSALEKDKFYGLRWTHQAFYIAEDGRLKEAREYAKVGVRLSSYSITSMLLLARIYQLEGMEKQMKIILNQAFQKYPGMELVKHIAQSSKQAKDFKQVYIPTVLETLIFE